VKNQEELIVGSVQQMQWKTVLPNKYASCTSEQQQQQSSSRRGMVVAHQSSKFITACSLLRGDFCPINFVPFSNYPLKNAC
jgi:hypothetical protein